MVFIGSVCVWSRYLMTLVAVIAAEASFYKVSTERIQIDF